LILVEEGWKKKFMKYEESLKIKTPILIDTIKRKIYIA
jgi:hypothetical protein